MAVRGRQMTVRKMTGIGFYGQPHQITKMLAKVLVRFDRLPLAVQPDGVLDEAGTTGHGPRKRDWRRSLETLPACVAMPQEVQLTGFFLAMAEGRVELHIRLRGVRRGGAQSTGC